LLSLPHAIAKFFTLTNLQDVEAEQIVAFKSIVGPGHVRPSSAKALGR